MGIGDLGTCYLAERELGSFVEVFRDVNPIPQYEIEERITSTYSVGRGMVLADCTNREARGFGVTGAMHSTEDYPKTQAWAAAFQAAGFDGVRYFVSHDPAQELIGVALFGRSETTRAPYERISPQVLEEAERLFGLRVLPSAGAAKLTR